MTVDAILYGAAAVGAGAALGVIVHRVLRHIARWPAPLCAAAGATVAIAVGALIYQGASEPVPSCIEFTPEASGHC